MRVVSIFESAEAIFDSTPRSRKYAVIAIRHGSKGIKSLNAAAVWVDAVISVSNAVNSYAKYAQSKEVTKRLIEETNILKKEIMLTMEKISIETSLFEKESEQRVKEVIRAFKVDKIKSDHVIDSLRLRIDSVKRISDLVRKIREQSEHDFDELQELLYFKDHLVRQTLSFVLDSTG